MDMMLFRACAALFVLLVATPSAASGGPWHFAVSGDSRNCGNVVMPSIAADATAHAAAFYWHLGDLRAIYDFDEDYRALHVGATISDYLRDAWPDAQRNQLEAFGTTPVFVGIGNHETIPPKTREQFVSAFADWLDAPALRAQRLKDDAHDHVLRTYFHWKWNGVDFISLDNATPDEFDAAQLAWLGRVLTADEHDAGLVAVVVGMHEALPESLARGHSMSDGPGAETSGLEVYARLLKLHQTKPVYVLASHSHFVMNDVFDTPYWRDHGGVLPGWIISTGGAVRYVLPPEASKAQFAKTRVYGYLLATVSPAAATRPAATGPAAPGSAAADRSDPIHFEFREVSEADVPADVAGRYPADLLHSCYRENAK